MNKQNPLINEDGTKYWQQNGKLHRLDGPAIERVSGNKYWYLDGIGYSEEDYWLRVILLQAQLKIS